MIFRLFRRGSAAGTIDALYGAIVAQARRPAFYLDYRVPDTAEGRFDMIVLHLALLCRRLGRESGPAQTQARALSQDVFDIFCRDMDHNLREMGVGDLSVPKKMKRMGEAFYGRLEVYDAALAAPDDVALAAALARNLVVEGASAAPLAAYVREAARRLEAAPFLALAAGRLDFPLAEIAEAAHEVRS
jgi:cytochrome b pre-mRNA-processing protein 3